MIDIQKATSNIPAIDDLRLQQAIITVLEHLERSEVDITLRLTDDAEMQKLNQSYRGIAKTTDVLSFSGDFLDPETGRWYLGDLVISVEQAARQAANQNHSLQDELHFLAIHGTLHLLGFDHATPSGKVEMWTLQEFLFKSIQTQKKEGN